MRESGYCVICVQTEENGDVCVCDSQGYCYPTIEFVRNKDVEVFGTAAVQPGNQEQGGSSGGSSSDGMIKQTNTDRQPNTHTHK